MISVCVLNWKIQLIHPFYQHLFFDFTFHKGELIVMVHCLELLFQTAACWRYQADIPEHWLSGIKIIVGIVGFCSTLTQQCDKGRKDFSHSSSNKKWRKKSKMSDYIRWLLSTKKSSWHCFSARDVLSLEREEQLLWIKIFLFS